jgi:small subunit ribosomal protein S17
MAGGKRKELTGVVLSTKMNKTIIVGARRKILHPLYKKYIVRSKKYYAHDEKGEAALGDKVNIIEARPLSKLKRWRLQKVIEKRVQ